MADYHEQQEKHLKRIESGVAEAMRRKVDWNSKKRTVHQKLQEVVNRFDALNNVVLVVEAEPPTLAFQPSTVPSGTMYFGPKLVFDQQLAGHVTVTVTNGTFMGEADDVIAKPLCDHFPEELTTEKLDSIIADFFALAANGHWAVLKQEP